MPTELLVTAAPDPPPAPAWTASVPPWPALRGAAAPAEHAVLVAGGTPRARAALWHDATARYRDAPATYVGHLAAETDDALTTLLDALAARTGRLGSRWLLGPIDGDTWHAYRLVVASSAEPSFPGEPVHPPTWPGAFAAAGMAPVERYWSACRAVDDAVDAPPPPPGVRLRPLDGKRPDADLDALHGIAIEAFASNPLFTPLDRAAFRTLYADLSRTLDPELCLVAEASGTGPIGLMLSLPAGPDRVALKTIAVAREHRGRGLGGALLAHAERAAARRGARRLVYALMHEDNESSRLVARRAAPCRRYALFGRWIAS